VKVKEKKRREKEKEKEKEKERRTKPNVINRSSAPIIIPSSIMITATGKRKKEERGAEKSNRNENCKNIKL